jgi:beta-N-acetylhexosaminidase
MPSRRSVLVGGAAAAAACLVPWTRPRRLDDLEREVGRLLWLGWLGEALPRALAHRVRTGRVGAVAMWRGNAGSADGFAARVAELRAAAPEPLLVSVTQEGGRIRPLVPELTAWPPALELGDRAGEVGRGLGDELAGLGVDVDFAPVLDVHTNPANPVIGDRAFATEPAAVIARARAFAGGLAASGILACGKHFPGHGDTALDSHHALPRVEHDRARLDRIELAPFAALAAELPLMMTAHVVYPALDPELPATLSPQILGLLRAELGFRGVIVTDDLEMRAIRDRWPPEEAAVLALEAGCDAILSAHYPELQERAAEGLIRAAERSPAIRARVVESAARGRALATARPRDGAGRGRGSPRPR